jgi:hypothetical protein
MKNKNELRFEPLPKPTIENLKIVRVDTSEFSEPEKAEAIINSLSLNIGDTIIENGDEFTINPRMVLEGTSPQEYKHLVDSLKVLLTKKEIVAMTKAIKSKAYDENLYHKIDSRLQKVKGKTEKEKNAIAYLKSQIHGISNSLYHLLSKGTDSYLVCFRCAWNDKPIPDQRTWNEKNAGEYRVLTGSEADSACEDYLDEDMWREAVSAENTTESYDDWKDTVINFDGRGQTLSSYDGSEEEQEVNGTTYYIYRTN